MPILPQELVIKILSYFKWIHDKEKFLHFLFPDYKYLLREEKILIIQRFFNPKIIELLGGLENMLNYPFIEHEYHFIAINDIDRIHLDDVYYPIMLGIDDLQRPYFTIRYKYEDKYIIDSYFQKLIGNKYFWNYASRYKKRFLYTLLYNNKFVEKEYYKIKNMIESIEDKKNLKSIKKNLNELI